MTDDADLERQAEEFERTEFVRRRRTVEDFRYDEQQEKYWDVTTGALLGPKSVDGAIPMQDWPLRIDRRNGEERPFKPSLAINDVDTGLTVEGATWWPGLPQFINNVVVSDRGAMPIDGAVAYNSYTPPERSRLRTDRNADPWIEHCKMLWPDPVEHEHFFDFCAHAIQRPDEKINHGIVMAGEQGIGKDTALLPIRRGVGEWNAAEIGPDEVAASYNPFVRSVLLVVNEVRPHDEDFRASNWYNQCKPLLAAPPEMLPMTMKYANTVYVRNVLHVVLTTNDPLRMYIPAEDRRLFVMTSPLPDPKRVPVFGERYFRDMYRWLEDGGADAVIRWLLNRPLDRFSAGEPPPMTRGKQAIIESSQTVRRTLIDDVFERYCEEVCGGNKPEVIFTSDLFQFVNEGPYFDDKEAAIKDLKRKSLHFKMSEHGYDMVKNPYSSEWRQGKFRSRMAFCLKTVSRDEQILAIEKALRKRPLDLQHCVQ